MSGVKWLYISKQNKVYKVPNPKGWKFKEIKEISGQDVLQVILYYKTENRKPKKLEIVEFDRITLDTEGGYELTDAKTNRVLNNVFQFIYNTPQELAKRNVPFELPIAPSVPSTKEKLALYEYLNEKFPDLGKDAPLIVERTINSQKKLHQQKINMIKEANFWKIKGDK